MSSVDNKVIEIIYVCVFLEDLTYSFIFSVHAVFIIVFLTSYIFLSTPVSLKLCDFLFVLFDRPSTSSTYKRHLALCLKGLSLQQ